MRFELFRPARRLLASLFSRPASAVGAILTGVFLLAALLGPLVAPYGSNQQIAAEARRPPSWGHPFGVDHLGRDVFSRVIAGAREILVLSGSGTVLAVLGGLCLGLVGGYLGGWIDEILMRLFDSFLSIPALLLALMLLGALGPSRWGVLLVIVLVYTPIVARVARSTVLSVKTRSFVEAAQLQGERTWTILWREIFPFVVPALSVEAALRFSYAIFLVASLGFLGVGVQPPDPDWGLMVKEARLHAAQAPWALYFPAGAIALVVIGANLTADGLKRFFQEPG